MKKYLIIILINITMPILVKAQLFTFGGSSQLYWTWRPDIDSNCYEFTYRIYQVADYLSQVHSNKISILYWNECNYGKAWMGASDTGFINEPLHDTLNIAVSQYGVVDTFCGFDSPYILATQTTQPSLVVSPQRKKFEYKGIVCLPEKCKRWHFAIGAFKYIGFPNILNSGTIHFNHDTFTQSNINNECFASYFGNQRNLSGTGFISGCTFNNLDFPDNSSVRFLSPPLYYFPLNKKVEYNPGAFDPDHDKLVVTLKDTIQSANWIQGWGSGTRNFFKVNDSAGIPHQNVFTWNCYFAPLQGQTGPNPLRYNAVNNPFDTDSTFQLVDSTGKTTFTAQSEMTPILYYSAKDYRNEQLVSESYFYTQFSLFNDSRPTSYINVDTISLLNANTNSQGTFVGCPNLPITFDAYIKLPGVLNGNLIVRTTADSTLPGNGACAVTNANTDSVHLQFSWTPPANARGLYNVYISAKDSNCNAPYNHYLQVYTWSFYIDSCGSVGVSSITKNDDILVYPNPAHDNLVVTSTNSFSSVKVYSMISDLVLEEKFAPTKYFDINTSTLPSGMYLVNIDGKFLRKVAIMR
jgi:hypothetical protein